MAELHSVGRSSPRPDARDKVTGEARYVGDLVGGGTLSAAVLRSPHHHARILAIDTCLARAMKGVVAVLTAADVPGAKTFGAMLPDRPVLAQDVVRHQGEPVTLVVAEDPVAAQRALEAIEVAYQELPALLDPVEALDPSAPLVHPGGNVVAEYDVGRGDVARGYAQADVVIEETYRVPRAYHAYLETESSLAAWQEDGTLKVWASSQDPFGDRLTISQVLDLPEERVRVIVPAVGGAFGGKEDAGLHVLAAFAAWATRGTVRLVNARQESMLAHPKRHAAVLRLKVGARHDGRLLALLAEVYLDTGAYANFGPAVGCVLSQVVTGPYRTPNVRVHTRVVYTNGPIGGAMRGFGSPQAAFVVESIMDVLASRLDVDPIELRRRNAWRQGERTPMGVLLVETPAVVPCLDEAERARGRLRQVATPPGKLSGVGVALGLQTMSPGDCIHRLEWMPDGDVRIHVGAPDLGQGLGIVAAQMAAEALGIDVRRIQVAGLDTSRSPNGGAACASRMTYQVGNAAVRAAQRAIEALLAEAARALEPGDPVTLTYRQGRVYRGAGDGKGIDAAEFIHRAAEEDRVLGGEATFRFLYPPDTAPQNAPAGLPQVLVCFAYGAHVARVEVDPDLGTVEVTEIVAIHDVGRAVNPAAVEGQIEGGVSMGIGYALQESFQLRDDGRWIDSLSEYLVPTALDMPPITPVVLEHPEPSGPYGARGVGEMGVPPVAPAIANAVAAATGVRITRLPIQPECLCRV
jgi:xanthine dehydrogenase molybdenum-binding subunit